MVGGARARFREFHRLVTQSLSGRLLLLTLLYLLLTETLLFVPSVGRYHRQLLDEHIQSAELAILPFTEPGGDSLSENMRAQLLKRAGAAAVVLKRADQKVRIPMFGKADSLNVSISAAIIVYEAVRQRMQAADLNSHQPVR